MSIDPLAELELAHVLADLCDEVTMPLFTDRSFTVEHKADHSEVTEADRKAEAMLASHLAAARPEHRLFGEEFGYQGRESSPFTWIVDPIDGTSGFARGIPIWATLIALEHETDGLLASVVSAPALGRRWSAAKGHGSTLNDRRCEVSTVDNISEAQINVTLNRGWDELGLTAALTTLSLEGRRSRGVGDFWQHCLVAEGVMDIAIDAVGVQPYDLAAVRLVVTEAGGSFTDINGRSSHAGPTAISSNGRLHSEVLSRLTPPVPYNE